MTASPMPTRSSSVLNIGIWGEMHLSGGTRQLAGAKPWRMGLRPVAYAAAVSSTV